MVKYRHSCLRSHNLAKPKLTIFLAVNLFIIIINYVLKNFYVNFCYNINIIS